MGYASIEEYENSPEYFSLCNMQYENAFNQRTKYEGKKLSNSMRYLDCAPYQPVYKMRNAPELVSYHNLNRLIKIYNIRKIHFDNENDDLLRFNIPLLRKNIAETAVKTIKITKSGNPLFVKERLRAETIAKYRGLSGFLFGV